MDAYKELRNFRPKDRKIVLVVEDEPPLLKAIKTVLDDADFYTVTCRSVDQALNMLDDIEDIDAVWLDHYLEGGKTGLDFLQRIRKEDRFSDLPLFVVSNTVNKYKMSEYLGGGAESYYVKANTRLHRIVDDIKDYFEHQQALVTVV